MGIERVLRRRLGSSTEMLLTANNRKHVQNWRALRLLSIAFAVFASLEVTKLLNSDNGRSATLKMRQVRLYIRR